jgi:hypothetical protein
MTNIAMRLFHVVYQSAPSSAKMRGWFSVAHSDVLSGNAFVPVDAFAQTFFVYTTGLASIVFNCSIPELSK